MDGGKGGEGSEGGGPRVCLRCGKIAASGDIFCTSCGGDLRLDPSPGQAGSTEVAAFKAARDATGQVDEDQPPVSRTHLMEMAGTAPAPSPYVATGGNESPYAPAASGAMAWRPYTVYPAARRLQPPKTDELAVASLVCAVASFIAIPFLPAVAAVILGVMSRKRIAGSEGGVEGEGLALAGIILGSLNLVLLVLILILVVAALLS